MRSGWTRRSAPAVTPGLRSPTWSARPTARTAPSRSATRRGDVLPLAFDHDRVLATAVARIRGKLDYAPIGFELLPETFTLRDLRLVHEAILGHPLNKDSFRRKVLDRGLVVATGERLEGVGHRPPELYRFVRPAGEPPR